MFVEIIRPQRRPHANPIIDVALAYCSNVRHRFCGTSPSLPRADSNFPITSVTKLALP
jgi:hypothetical protein